jgi:hypothetical protein
MIDATAASRGSRWRRSLQLPDTGGSPSWVGHSVMTVFLCDLPNRRPAAARRRRGHRTSLGHLQTTAILKAARSAAMRTLRGGMVARAPSRRLRAD